MKNRKGFYLCVLGLCVTAVPLFTDGGRICGVLGPTLVLFGVLWNGLRQSKAKDERKPLSKPSIVNTVEKTPQELIEDAEEVITTTYYEMSDGTWKTDGHTYQHKLVISGRLNNAVRDITYTILSNVENITFEQAWKASGLSSNIEDYFKIEDAVFVAVK